MSAKHSTNFEKPYLACTICDVKFIRTINDWVTHIIQNHADDLEKRGPKICRDFIKLARTFYDESD